MQLSSTVAKLPGVEQASAIMASANNMSLLKEAGLLGEPIEAVPTICSLRFRETTPLLLLPWLQLSRP